MRSLEICGTFLLLNHLFAWRSFSPEAQGRFVVAAALPDISAVLVRALHVPWLGPGLIIAAFLLITLRGARTMGRKPLHLGIRPPRLERYQRRVRRQRQDLEV